MNADGSGEEEITEGDFYTPVWSPDGSKIAFVCFGDDLSEDICLMNANWSDLKRVTQAPDFEFDYSPAWSPDGTKILFVRDFFVLCGFLDFPPCTDNGILSVMNADGSNPQLFLSSLTTDNTGWSPDGTRITFDNSQSASNSPDIFVADSSGTGVTNLSNHPARDFDPSWGPQLSTPGPNTVQFSSSSYTVTEGAAHVDINITRSGDTSGAATVDYRTTDTDTFTVDCADRVNNHGGAFGRCDYVTTAGTLSFAAGETSKTFSVPVVDDAYAEGSETFSVVLSNAAGATLGSTLTAAVTINDNETADGSNPILQTNDPGIAFFVRQHYLDFLGREPEPGEPWSNVLRGCSDQFNTDPNSPSAGCDRILVSGSFFGSPEFKDKGIYVLTSTGSPSIACLLMRNFQLT